jgi:hypothetical protein
VAERRQPRLTRVGDLVQPPDGSEPELVRSVSVILHLANGMDYRYTDEDRVEVLDPPPPEVTEDQVEEATSQAD